MPKGGDLCQKRDHESCPQPLASTLISWKVFFIAISGLKNRSYYPLEWCVCVTFLVPRAIIKSQSLSVQALVVVDHHIIGREISGLTLDMQPYRWVGSSTMPTENSRDIAATGTASALIILYLFKPYLVAARPHLHRLIGKSWHRIQAHPSST